MPRILNSPRRTAFFPLVVVCIVMALGTLSMAQSQNRLPDMGDAHSRAQQNDQNQQQLDQYRQQQAIAHTNNDIEGIQKQMQDEARERALWKQILEANFRRRYEVIHKNSEELVQLTSELLSSIQNNQNPALSHEMLETAGKIQRRAHEIRTTLAGRRLPKVKPAAGALTLGALPVAGAERVEALNRRSELAVRAASKLRKAVEDYLATDNAQSVSVNALKSASDKTRFNPNMVAMLTTSMELEQLACDIRIKPSAR